jgi:YD repeat-containing protein
VPFPLIQPAQAATRSEVAVFLSRFALSAPEESQLTPAVLTAVQEGSQGLSLVITTGSEDNSGGDAALSLSVRVDARGQATYTCTRIQDQTGTAAPSESLTYDDQGRLVQVVDTANRTTYTIQYDGRGNPAFVTISPDFLEQTVYAFHYTAGESSWQWAAVAQDGANLLAL